MAIDPLIPNFSPSIQVPVIRRRPQADHLNGKWNLEGATVHRGANSLGDNSLMPVERRLLVELLRAYEDGLLETALEYLGAVEKAHVDDSEYWLASCMCKLSVDSILGLIEAAHADPSILKAPEGGEQFGPRPQGVMGRLAGV
jgi:hypothetical protein